MSRYIYSEPRYECCSECRRQVCDIDVECSCGNTQCYKCIVQYDYKTALFAMNARVLVNRSYPDILVKELKPFQKQLETMVADMNAFRTTYDEEMVKFMFDALNRLIKQYGNVGPNTIIANDNNDLRAILVYFRELFELITEYEIYQFICHRCNAYAVRDKYATDLEVENAKLRQEITELKECMNMANEDKRLGGVNVTYIVDDPSRLL